jgi:hypothetical protein
MSRRQTQIVVVCEDRTQEVFLRRCLQQLGYHPKRVRTETAPRGRGAGERFVLTQYAHELTQYRIRSHRNPQFHRLVVVIDADTGTVREHEVELTAAAISTGQSPRQPREGIVHLIPKRNVETWIHRLLGNPADEATDYKPAYRSRHERDYCQPAAEQLVAIVRDPTQTSDLPSLNLAVTELRQKLNGTH